MTPQAVVGGHIVFPTSNAREKAWSLCDGKARDMWKLRKHAFNLVYWPEGDAEQETDVDWEWIEGLQKFRIGELRIDERINAKSNIRIIFWKANQRLIGEPVPRIWLLDVFPKKRQDFGNGRLAAWRGMRVIIVDRYYCGLQSA